VAKVERVGLTTIELQTEEGAVRLTFADAPALFHALEALGVVGGDWSRGYQVGVEEGVQRTHAQYARREDVRAEKAARAQEGLRVIYADMIAQAKPALAA
jgi:hypothetical protein